MRSTQLYTNIKAIAWVTVGTALFSLIFASGKFANGGASSSQILFFRYVGGLATLLVVVVARRERLSAYRSAKPLSHFMRAIFGASGGGALIYASANMPIIDATAIGLLYVVFVVPLGVVVLKERITWSHLGAIGICCGERHSSWGLAERSPPSMLHMFSRLALQSSVRGSSQSRG